jgi:hypothetical protein
MRVDALRMIRARFHQYSGSLGLLMKYGEVESLAFVAFEYVDVYKVRLGIQDLSDSCRVTCRGRRAEIRDGVLTEE